MIEFLTVLNDNVRLFCIFSLPNPEGPGPCIDHLLPALHGGGRDLLAGWAASPHFYRAANQVFFAVQELPVSIQRPLRSPYSWSSSSLVDPHTPVSTRWHLIITLFYPGVHKGGKILEWSLFETSLGQQPFPEADNLIELTVRYGITLVLSRAAQLRHV